ncbi:DUF262 domain-containing protein [Campylobacter concisus]|uniref:DUF262 domain-containing protein n=1 Tax=Campylobacter concisus UNSW2 TaxID=1242965 RepID=U2GSN0_9BACT|nr:DUF262 domain-containing protein [Campylobacter concisus]ERJ31034.1 hypothetical protein UNSW2_996 [Campylobacter concisus UNSW2]
MEARKNNIGSFKKLKFEIPFYQRAYSWKKQDIEKLIRDININCKEGHYLGNIVVKKNDDKFIVIDGQQRLTTIYIIFMALKEKLFELDYEIDSGDGEKLNNFDINEHRYVNKQILDAVIFASSNKTLREPSFKGKLNSAIFTMTIIPENIKATEYFELVNTKSIQLENHQVLKARFLSNIKDNYAGIARKWDMISNMDEKYKDQILESNQADFSIEPKTIRELLESDFNDKEKKQTETNSDTKSLVKFPVFLLLALKVFVAKKELKIDIIINKDKLLGEFDKVFKEEADLCSEFVEFLGDMRNKFDEFVYRDDEMQNKRLLNLERMFYYTSEYDKPEFIAALLAFLDKNSLVEYNDENAQKAIKFLEQLDNKLAKSALDSSGDRKVVETINNVIEKIYNGENLEAPMLEKIDSSFLDKGTSVPHYWFYRLEYMLWRDFNSLSACDTCADDIKKVFPKFNRDEYLIKSQDTVEHMWATNLQENGKALDDFGNLALIRKDFNSSLSDYDFGEKLKRIKESPNSSIKMLIFYASQKGYDKDMIGRLGNEMKQILFQGIQK